MAEQDEELPFLPIVRDGGQRRKRKTHYEQMGENIEKALKQRSDEINKLIEKAEPAQEFFDLFGRGS